MNIRASVLVACATLIATHDPVLGQDQSQPLYRLTVVERNTKAINYQYRSGPTKIDFRGTVLLPDSEGEATIESKRGRTEIDARFEDLPAPSRFGREYLTYVLWAITVDGRPHNLGEIVTNSSDDSRMRLTTDLQAFALIVTAEPYAAVRQPSDVVVMQNEVRPDTVGRIEQVSVKYELMPRGHYVYQKVDEKTLAAQGGEKVSMGRYEELLALYQAQNAIGIAESQNAAKFAPEVLTRAQQLYAEARKLEQSKAGHKRVVQIAKEASQTAEDARILANRRQQDDKLAEAELARSRAEADARQARADAEAARSQVSSETQSISTQTVPAVESGSSAPATETEPLASSEQPSLRVRLISTLNQVLDTRDTPRGLVATIPDSAFLGHELREQTSVQLARIADVLSSYPGLRVTVEGHTDRAADTSTPARRAEVVRAAMRARGLPNSAISVLSWGDSRPVAANNTNAGREQNRRVDIVISGDPLGPRAAR